MDGPKIAQPDDISWEPHPQLSNVQVAVLLSNRDERADLTCMLVHLPPGTEVERHAHECDDIAYVIKGKTLLWIEGVGEVPMTGGSFVRIPKSVQHQMLAVEEETLICDVFYPFLAYMRSTQCPSDRGPAPAAPTPRGDGVTPRTSTNPSIYMAVASFPQPSVTPCDPITDPV